MTTWAVITGEYPPQAGGVSDYTRQVCRGLAAAGDRVTVFAPPCPHPAPTDGRVSVIRLPDQFGSRGRACAETEIVRLRPDRVLVQYVPHAFGAKGVNVPFAWWVRHTLRRLAPVWVTVHEAAFPFVRRPLRHNLIAGANRLMARLVADAADRLFVTTHAWGDLLRRLAPRCAEPEWLPVPSNLPTEIGADARPSLPAGVRIGHFGTYGLGVVELLETTLSGVLQAAPERLAVLIGRNGDSFRDRFVTRHPDLGGRVVATGELPAEGIAARIAACELCVQPYPDGVSGRRTTATALLALGVPVVTNLGPLSERCWAAEGRGVMLASAPTASALLAAAEAMLALSPAERAAIGQAGRHWYAERFALERVLAVLRGEGRS
jgi:glycosyltransferase involved in cell wall biosynthesis